MLWSVSLLVGLPTSYLNLTNTVFATISIRFTGFPFSVKSWLTWHCHDGMLDAVRRVCLPRVPSFRWTVLMIYDSIGGYYSSRVYASLGGTDRKRNSFLTATVLPTCVSNSLNMSLSLILHV